jgi:hypothetical protein
MLRTGRGRALVVILLVSLLSYLALALGLGAGSTPSERSFGDVPGDDARQLGVYIEVLAIDAVNDVLRLRISFTPGPPAQHNRPAVTNRDIKVRLDDGDNEQDITFPANQPMAAAAFDADLNDGSIAGYPLDRYRVVVHIAAREAGDVPVPLRVTLWDGIAGWTLDVTEPPRSAAGELQLSVRRSVGLRVLALAIYVEMALVAGVALTVGGMVFLRIRAAESTLIGALVGMLFALPAMRYAVPGSPPLGVRADLLVFFWAELALVLGLGLFMMSWVRAERRG